MVRAGLRRVVTAPAKRAALALARPRHSLGGATDRVALTFDDGPDPVHTPAVLDRLRDVGAVATFFVVGERAARHPEIVRRILAEGHALGSHSWSHPEPWRLSAPALIADYRRGRAAVQRAAGRRTALFRPPKGFVDARGAVAMLAAGVRPWLWTIDGHDWLPDVRPDEIVGRLGDIAGGDVVLLHDAIEQPLAPSALDRSATVQAIGDIAALVAGRGLRFTTLG